MSKGSKASSQKRIPYEIGPPAWIKKKILNTNNRYFVSTVIFILINLGIGKDHLSFPQVFFYRVLGTKPSIIRIENAHHHQQQQQHSLFS